MAYRWKPSKSKCAEFAIKMKEIDKFCSEHGIQASTSSDSYYFSVQGKYYRVSNHSVEASYINSNGKYHIDGRKDDVIYIHAGKTRIMQIYNDLVAGYILDGRGNRK